MDEESKQLLEYMEARDSEMMFCVIRAIGRIILKSGGRLVPPKIQGELPTIVFGTNDPVDFEKTIVQIIAGAVALEISRMKGLSDEQLKTIISEIEIEKTRSKERRT